MRLLGLTLSILVKWVQIVDVAFVSFLLVTFIVVKKWDRSGSSTLGVLDIAGFVEVGVQFRVRVVLDLVVDSTSLFI